MKNTLTKFNNNIRCIEIADYVMDMKADCVFNNNIRCIEIDDSQHTFHKAHRLITT